MTLALPTQVALAASGAILLLALLLGVWKFVAMVRSPDGQAHVYVDISHRAALMYAFASAVLAPLVQFNAWPTGVTTTAVVVMVALFVGTIATYTWHGWRRDTTNQMHPLGPWILAGMVAIIVGEIGGTVVILSGFLVEQVG